MSSDLFSDLHCFQSELTEGKQKQWSMKFAKVVLNLLIGALELSPFCLHSFHPTSTFLFIYFCPKSQSTFFPALIKREQSFELSV
jgi:hypothetical protein